MIELLVDHIRGQSFTVVVRPGYLVIEKQYNGQRCNVNWAISRIEINSAISEDHFFAIADRYMQQIDAAIAQRKEEGQQNT